MERTYCVYKHTNRTNGKVYIGITTKRPKARWDNGRGYRENPHFWNAIQKYGWDGFDHEILAENLEPDDAYAMEIALIAKYQANCPDFGYNRSTGGEGAHTGVVCSEETRRKLSELNTGERHPMWGKPGAMLGRKHSEETRRKMSETRRGQKKTKEWVQKIADAQRGTKLGSDSHLAKEVDQFTKDGVFVKRWSCMIDAARGVNICPEGITKACRGVQKTAGGYIWRYVTK